MIQYSCTIFSIYKAQCYKILPQYQGESVVVERHQTFWNVARGIFFFSLVWWGFGTYAKFTLSKKSFGGGSGDGGGAQVDDQSCGYLRYIHYMG